VYVTVAVLTWQRQVLTGRGRKNVEHGPWLDGVSLLVVVQLCNNHVAHQNALSVVI
jgi:hypothetical protein